MSIDEFERDHSDWFADVDSARHYQRPPRKSDIDHAQLGGILIGSVLTFVALVLWEVVRR